MSLHDPIISRPQPQLAWNLSQVNPQQHENAQIASEIITKNASDVIHDSEMDNSSHTERNMEKDIVKALNKADSVTSVLSNVSSSGDGPSVKVSENYSSIPYDIQLRTTYEHHKKNSEIMGVTYNGRMRQFVILDSKGITTWKRDATEDSLHRALLYPKYEYKSITHLMYTRKYNCYFALAKDFSLKVMNRDFHETCSVSADLRSVLFMLFNPIRDELITGGVGGTKIWKFHQVSGKAFQELKPLSNYKLSLIKELANVGGSWVKRVDLNHHLQHLYCCSDTDLYVYDLQGNLLQKYMRAHKMSITACVYSVSSRVLLTSSVDTDIKVWSLTGGLVHTFRGHSKPVTNLVMHPETSSIVISCSGDGTVRMWSLDTMEPLYNLGIAIDEIKWMGLTDDKLLYTCTGRNISIWSLNFFYQFWSLARNKLRHLSLAGCEKKTTRVVAVGEDSSVRLFARSNQKNLSTVLPPPKLSPFKSVLSICYIRDVNAVFMLPNPKEIWVYTTRTDPACRIAVWIVHQLQLPYLSDTDTKNAISALLGFTAPTHRATENGYGNELISNCSCLCSLNSSVCMWTDEGFCSPLKQAFLLLGLEDGRILFMDPVVKGQKYMEFKASKDIIQDMRHDQHNNTFITLTKLKEFSVFEIWSLPRLQLLHEVFCCPDLLTYTRLGNCFVIGHENGYVNFHTLQPAEDLGLKKVKVLPDYDEIVNDQKRPEHKSAVLAVDSSPLMNIVLSCSCDGAIKIWDIQQMLLTEIMLDDSLSTACFLNSKSDIVVAFKNHIFFIDHTKVCPGISPLEEDTVDTFDQESDVYEDPAVKSDSVGRVFDKVNLENYLVPFELEFSKDFLEGKKKGEIKRQKEIVEEVRSESELSMAPTEIYFSPSEAPSRLSEIDLTLGADIDKQDLRKHMEETLRIIVERAEQRRKEELAAPKQKGLRGWKKVKKRHKMKELLFQIERKEKKKDLRHLLNEIEFPEFGESPGPTPCPSTPTTPGTPSSFSMSEGFSSEEEIDKSADEVLPAGSERAKGDKKVGHDKETTAVSPRPKISTCRVVIKSNILQELPKSPEPEKTAEKKDEDETPVVPSMFSNVKVDVKALMKEDAKRAALARKDADHTHVKKEEKRIEKDPETPRKIEPIQVTPPKVIRRPVSPKTIREVHKKQQHKIRKFPKRGLKPKASLDAPKPLDHASTQMSEEVAQTKRITEEQHKQVPVISLPDAQDDDEIEEEQEVKKTGQHTPKSEVPSKPSAKEIDPVLASAPLPPRKFGAAAVSPEPTKIGRQSPQRRPISLPGATTLKSSSSQDRGHVSSDTEFRSDDEQMTAELQKVFDKSTDIDTAKDVKRSFTPLRRKDLEGYRLRMYMRSKHTVKDSSCETIPEDARKNDDKKQTNTMDKSAMSHGGNSGLMTTLQSSEINVDVSEKFKIYPLLLSGGGESYIEVPCFRRDSGSTSESVNARPNSLVTTESVISNGDLPVAVDDVMGHDDQQKWDGSIPEDEAPITCHDLITYTEDVSTSAQARRLSVASQCSSVMEKLSQQSRNIPNIKITQASDSDRSRGDGALMENLQLSNDNQNGTHMTVTSPRVGSAVDREKQLEVKFEESDMEIEYSGRRFSRVTFQDDIQDTRSTSHHGVKSATVKRSPRQQKIERSKDDSGRDETLLTEAEKARLKRRPKSSFVRKYSQDSDESADKRSQRPHTAHVRFQEEKQVRYFSELPSEYNDLEEAFYSALQRYKKLCGQPRGKPSFASNKQAGKCSPDSSDKFYRNDGVQFEDNWQDRIIERHMLIKMQRQLRAHSAVQRRQAMEQRQINRQKESVRHKECGGDFSRADSTLHGIMQLERTNTPIEYPPELRGMSPYPSMLTVPDYRPVSQASTRTGTIAVMSTSSGSHLVKTDPEIVSSAPTGGDIPKESAKLHEMLNKSLQTSATKQKPRPKTAHAALQRTTEDKSQLSFEKPFRLRLGQNQPARKSYPKADIHAIDPRNPNALRPKSSKSIPGKCSRYILVSRPKQKSGLSQPSPLEEQLLSERFPQQSARLFNKYSPESLVKFHRNFGIEYSPFVCQLNFK